MRHLHLSLLLLPASVPAQFGTAHVVTEGDLNYPTIVISADINGDGYMDLVSMRRASSAGEVSSVLWWANDGQGTFGDAQALLGNLPSGFTLHGFADLDSDGLADMIAYPNTNNPAHWYRNTGGAVAAPVLLYSASLSNFILHDLDNDGAADIIGRTPSLQVLMNNGTGTFTPGAVLGTVTGTVNTLHLQLADLNGDGDTDLLVGGENPWRGTYAGAGNGTFGTQQTIANFSLQYTPRLGDMDGDGDIDLLGCGLSGGIRLFTNEGGAFTLTDTLMVGSLATFIPDVVKDIDGDGLADMTKYTGTTCDVVLSRNNGNGTFSDRQLELFSAYSLQGTRYAVADLDNDGDQDVAFVHGQGLMGWFAQETPVQWSPRKKVSWTVSATRDLASADFDSNGTPDLVAASEYASMVTLHRNDGTGMNFQRSIIAENFHRVTAVGTADLDGDGDMDVVASNTSEAKWFANNGDGSVWTAHTIPGAAGPFSMGDVDGDGHADLMFAGQLYRNQGGSFTAEQVLAGATVGRIKDMDGDGDPDLLMSHTGGFTVATNDGNGSFTFTPYVTTLSANFMELADMDGDGLLDIIGRAPGNIMICYLLDGAGGVQLDTIATDLPQSSDGTIACVDLDLDGDMDIMWSRSYGYTHQSYSIENLGNMTFGGNTLVDPSAEVTRKFLFTDLDGDGLLDLAVGRHHSIRWYPNLYPNPFRLKGAVFLDANEDGVLDVAETRMPYQLVKSNGQQAMTWTNSLGSFSIPASPGTWDVSSPLQPMHFATTPDTLTATLNATTPTAIDLDFGRKLFPADPVFIVYSNTAFRCDTDDMVRLIARNPGGQPYAGGLIDLFIGGDLVYIEAFPAPDSVVNGHYYWNLPPVPAQGQQVVDVRLQVGPVNSAAQFFAQLTVPGFTDIMDYHLDGPVTCAYDPNDKQVLPVGFGEFHAVDIDTPWLDYTVRFQNTGTDTAFVVVIEDVLDADLDPASMQVLATSHTITDIHLDDGNKLVFRHDGILLPDSNVDPLGSNGFVRFRIRPYADRPSGTEIHNTAGIVFDQNPAIITNTTLTTLVDCNLFHATIIEGDASLLASEGIAYQWLLNGDTIPGGTGQTMVPNWGGSGVYTVSVTSLHGCVSLSDPFIQMSTGVAEVEIPQMLVVPNPARQDAILRTPDVLLSLDQVLLLDAQGRLLFTATGNGTSVQTIDRRGVAPGLYFIRILRNGMHRGSVPLVFE